MRCSGNSLIEDESEVSLPLLEPKSVKSVPESESLTDSEEDSLSSVPEVTSDESVENELSEELVKDLHRCFDVNFYNKIMIQCETLKYDHENS